MSRAASQTEQIKENLREAAQKVAPFVEHFARFGFVAKGATYLLLGALAAVAPIGMADLPKGRRGALEVLLRQPAGWVLLAAIAIGLLAFGVWQLIRALEDPESEGNDSKGIAKRIGFVWNAMIQFALAAGVGAMAMGWRRAAADDDYKIRDWTGWVMSYPIGRWIVAAAGIGVMIYGARQIWRGICGKLDRRLILSNLPESGRRFLRGASCFGIAARGVVFGLLGAFLVMSAWHFNADEAHGLGGTLRQLAVQPYGKWLLGIAALGLIAYGLYNFILARYRSIAPPTP